MSNLYHFAGDLDECIMHASNSSDLDNIISILKTLTGVSKESVSRWFSKNPVRRTHVRSDKAISVAYVLNKLGYEVVDIVDNDPVIYDFGKLIAFNRLAIESAVTMLDYSEPASLTKVILGKSNTSDSKKEKMAKYNSMYKDEIEALERAIFKKAAPMPDGFSEDIPEPEQGFSNNLSVTERHSIVISLANSVKTTIGLAKLVASDSFTAEDRALFRNNLEKNEGMHIVTSTLTKLAGERARTSVIQQESNPL